MNYVFPIMANMCGKNLTATHQHLTFQIYHTLHAVNDTYFNVLVFSWIYVTLFRGSPFTLLWVVGPTLVWKPRLVWKARLGGVKAT